MLFNDENSDVLDLLAKMQEATTSEVDEERGTFKKGDKVTYNMFGGSLSNDDFVRTLGVHEHAIRVRHDGAIAEIVEAMGEEVARYSIQFTDGFIINDVAVSEVKAITEAEDATQTMKPQEKPALDAEDANMEDYSEEDLNKPEAKIKSKSEKSGDAIRGVEDKELEQKEDKVEKPKNESKVDESVQTDIKRYKDQLERKAKKSGLWENFGQKQVGLLEDKYSDHQYKHDGIWDAIRVFDKWCQSYTGKNESKVEEAERKDHIPGGQGDKKVASDFNAEQVKIGTKIEMEHTDDPVIAGEIVLDHLKEDPEYYTKLVRMEAGACDTPKKESKVAEGEMEVAPSKVGIKKISDENLKKLHDGSMRSWNQWKDSTQPENGKLAAQAIKQYEDEMIVRGLKSEDQRTTGKFMAESALFTLLKKQEPLRLCNECFKTFRSTGSCCEFCASPDTESLVEGYGDLVGSAKEVFQVTWDDAKTGKEESTRVMAFDKDDAKREMERNPNKKVTKVEGPIVSKSKDESAVSEDYTEVHPGKYLVMYYDGYKEEISAQSKVDAMKKGRENYPEKRISNVRLLEQENKSPFDHTSEGSELQEAVLELVGETPGIDIEDQKILRWALEQNAISNEWPSVEQMIDVVTELDVIDTSGADDPDGLDLGEIEAVYLKYVLLPKATAAFAKSVSESEVTEMAQEGIPVAGKTYHITQTTGWHWPEGDYKVTDVQYLRCARGDLAKQFQVEGNDNWWIATFYHFKEADGVKEAQKEVKPFRTIEIVKSKIDPDVFNIRVVELPRGITMIVTTEPTDKMAIAKGKEIANLINAKFLGIVDEAKLKEREEGKLPSKLITKLTSFAKEHGMTLAELGEVPAEELDKKTDESKVTEQEEDTFTTVGKGMEKEDAEKLAQEKDGQVVTDEDNPEKFAVITKGKP